MWTRKKENGRVLFSERFQNPMTGKEIKLSVTLDKDTAANRRKAMQLLQAKFEQKCGKYAVKKESLTLGQLIEIYETQKSAEVEASSLKRDKSNNKSFIEALGSDTLITKLSARYFYERMFADANIKKSTYNNKIVRFKVLMNWAYRHEYIEDIRWLDRLTPLDDKEGQAKKKKALEEKYFERDELKKVIDDMTVTRWKYVAQFAALTGMRIGEIIALDKKDIDLKKKVIHVSKNYDYNNKILKTTKTAESTRDVPIQPELEKLITFINHFQKRMQIEGQFVTPLFISDENGNYFKYASYNKHLDEHAKKTVGKHATTHIMRHTHVALMAEEGVPLETITRRLGHADSKITKEVYYHVTRKMKQKDYESVKDVYML